MEEEKYKFERYSRDQLQEIGMFQKPSKYKLNYSEEELKKDLERYKDFASKLGCQDAEIIPTSIVDIDERVQLRCRIPVCRYYGTCINCPPHTPSVEKMKRIISKYEYGLIIRSEVEPKEDFIDPQERNDIPEHHKKGMEKVGVLEAQAFSDGYRFAIGFSGGGCRDNLCRGQSCKVLEGYGCRFPLKARPSMESVGIDVAGLAEKVGWDVYPVRARPIPAEEFDFNPVTIGVIFVQ